MNLVLTRQLAIIQARLKILDGFSDALTELSDMKELRKLRVEVEEYLQIQRAKGTVPPNPAEYVSGEVDQIEQALQEANSIHADCMGFASELFKPKTIQITIDELDSLESQLEEKRRLLPEELDQLKNRFFADHWQRNGDVQNSILFFAKLRCPQSTIHNVNRMQLHLLSLGKGSLWNQVEDHLQGAQKILPKLENEYLEAKPHYEAAARLADEDNYLQADKSLNRFPNRVINSHFKVAKEKIRACQQKLDKYNSTELESRLTNLMAKPLTFNPVRFLRSRKERTAAISSFGKWILEEESKLAIQPRCDLRGQSASLLDSKNAQFEKWRSDVKKETVGLFRLWLVAAVLVVAAGRYIILLFLR